MGGFVTAEARVRFRVLADQVDAAYDGMWALSSAEVGSEFRTELAERLETLERANRGLMYRVFGEIADPPDGRSDGAGAGEQLGGAAADPAAEGQASDESGRTHPAAAPQRSCPKAA
jgi:hypothetical protein